MQRLHRFWSGSETWYALAETFTNGPSGRYYPKLLMQDILGGLRSGMTMQVVNVIYEFNS